MKSKTSKRKEKSPPRRRGVNLPKRGVLSKDFWNLSAFRLFLILTVVGLGIFMRLAFLSADPPLDLSWSQDVNTDPAQYTSFARSKVLWGEWDPFGISFLILWLNSAYSLVSLLFFKLLGVGRWQANLIAASLSSLTLVFFYLAIKTGINRRTGLLAAFFLGINYILVMYGRTTFAEVPVVLFIVLGIYFWVSGLKRGWILIFSGACFAVSIFFGKMLAMFMLPVCLGVIVMSGLDEFSANHRKIKFSPLLLFAAGFLVVWLFWFFVIYSPSREKVSEFVSAMSVGMYGSPQAFQSIPDFVYSLFSFGDVAGVLHSERYLLGTDLFFRMPFIFILSGLFLLSLFFRIFRRNNFFKNLRSCSKLELFFALWLVVGVLALMPWNYRPLRYQILIIPPMCALAAFCLFDFLNPANDKKKAKNSVWFWIFSIPTISFLTLHTLSFFLKMFQKTAQLSLIIIVSLSVSFPLAYLFYLVKRRRPFSIGQRYRLMMVGVVVFLVVVVNGGQFLTFAQDRRYSFLHASEDLGLILSSEAVISGPYAQTLAMDNKLGLVLRMFAGWPVDRDLFQKYPLTHLAIEAGGGHRAQALKDFPQVMTDAKLVTAYHLRNFPVQILRVAESSGNPQTQDYRLSDFEKARLLMEQGFIDSAIVMLNQFVWEYPRNFSGYMTLGEIYYDRQDFQKAASLFDQASNFDPANFLAHQLLGGAYLNLYDQERNDAYLVSAIEEWEKSLRLFPQNVGLSVQLKKLRNLRGY